MCAREARREERSEGEIIYDMVHLWTNIVDEDQIRKEVHKWTKGRTTRDLKHIKASQQI